MNKKPLVFMAADGLWHGIMRLPKLISCAGADVVLMCRTDFMVSDSRYVKKILQVEGTFEEYAQAVISHLREYGARYTWCTIPDEGLLRELRHFDDPLTDSWYPHARDAATIEFIHSKLRFMKECLTLGIPVPAFQFCNNLDDLEKSLQTLAFPLVAKAISSSGGSGVRITHSALQLLEAVADIGFPLALQRYVDGQPFSTEVLYDHGVPVCWSSSAQLNRWPHELGSITAKKMIEVPGIEHTLIQLGKRTQFHGIACIDAIKPNDGSSIVFCEMNPMQGVEATSDKRVFDVFAAALGRILRREPSVTPTPMPVDKNVIGLFPETFYYLKSHPKSFDNWLIALRSLRHAPYDDIPLLLRLCADLLCGLTPRMGMRKKLTMLLSRQKASF